MVRFSGTGTSAEGDLAWAVHAADGDIVASGTTTAGTPRSFDRFGFEVDLPPGSYLVQVRSSAWQDDRAFTVR